MVCTSYLNSSLWLFWYRFYLFITHLILFYQLTNRRKDIKTFFVGITPPRFRYNNSKPILCSKVDIILLIPEVVIFSFPLRQKDFQYLSHKSMPYTYRYPYLILLTKKYYLKTRKRRSVPSSISYILHKPLPRI